jgi:hypothetical protein
MKRASRIGGRFNAYKVFVGKPEAKKEFGRTRCRGKDNIEVNRR